MTITYYYFLLKGKYYEIRTNAQQREYMVIPDEKEQLWRERHSSRFQAEK